MAHRAHRKPGSSILHTALTLASLVLVACAAQAPQGEPTGERRVDYACDNGEQVQMRFFPLQGVGVLVRGGRTMELQQQRAGSGFLYSNGPNSVRGKGDELKIEVGRMVPLRCREVRRGGPGGG